MGIFSAMNVGCDGLKVHGARLDISSKNIAKNLNRVDFPVSVSPKIATAFFAFLNELSKYASVHKNNLVRESLSFVIVLRKFLGKKIEDKKDTTPEIEELEKKIQEYYEKAEKLLNEK